MKRVDFFIIGAAKAGTTSLYNYLQEHPDIYFSPVKEPNYFATDININQFSEIYRKNTFLDLERYFKQKPLQFLQLTYVRKASQYEQLFHQMKSEKIAGEASTSYMVSAEAAQNIYHHNPEAKIIAVLRNPAERAFSHYLMALRYGHVKGPFRKVLEKDMKQHEKGIGISEMFIEFGQYATQLRRYFSWFPERQIKVILFDELEGHTNMVVQDVLKFLEMKPIDIKADEQFNASKIPSYPRLNKLITELGIKSILKYSFDKRRLEWLKKIMMTSGDNKILSKADRSFLSEVYKEEIESLSEMIGRDLTHWYK